jgi:hypothetical protein
MFKKWYHFLSPRYQNLALDYPVEFKPRFGHGKEAHPELYKLINAERERYAEWISKMTPFIADIHAIKKQDENEDINAPVWNNGFLPGLDIVSIYGMIAQHKPNTYIEVGSGNSTKVAFKARKDQQLTTRIVSIDPMPRAEIDHLSTEVIRQPFENCDLSPILALEAGDILFIDNSHRILPNSDATVFFLEVLPRLKKGVIVHIHDIYLPFDYPQFMCDRGYSEQYGLAMFLLANAKKYRPVLPNYFISQDAELAKLCEPFWDHPTLKGVERHGGSFWLEIAE